MFGDAILIVFGFVVLLMALFTIRAVQIVPQARARNVERLGRYRKTLEPGMNFIIPVIDRVKPLIDLREQVVSFLGAPVITEDNLVVLIDTVLFFQVTDPRAADYEIVNYIQAIEQLTATMLRSVIGSMDLEQSLTSRDRINTMLRGVLDDASGKWGIRVTRVEIKKIDPPVSVKEAMEKQMRAEREKRAAILTAEGVRQSQILTADGDKQGTILRAEGDKQSAILRAEGQAQAIGAVFQSIHDNNPDPKLLAYQYIQTLPQIAQGTGNSVWVIPSEVTGALRMLGSAFGGSALPADEPAAGRQAEASQSRTVTGQATSPAPAIAADSAEAVPGQAGVPAAALAANPSPDGPGQAGPSAAAPFPDPSQVEPGLAGVAAAALVADPSQVVPGLADGPAAALVSGPSQVVPRLADVPAAALGSDPSQTVPGQAEVPAPRPTSAAAPIAGD